MFGGKADEHHPTHEALINLVGFLSRTKLDDFVRNKNNEKQDLKTSSRKFKDHGLDNDPDHVSKTVSKCLWTQSCSSLCDTQAKKTRCVTIVTIRRSLSAH